MTRHPEADDYRHFAAGEHKVSQGIADGLVGTYRVQTKAGLSLDLPEGFPEFWIEHVATQADGIANANYLAGKRDAQTEFRAAIGIGDGPGGFRRIDPRDAG